MARPHVTPLNHEILYAQSDASGNATPLTYNTVTGGLDVNIVGGSSAGTQYQELATTSPGTGTLTLGRYNSSNPTLTNGQMESLQLDSTGALRVSSSASASPAVSSLNSTTATLLAAATFTGTAEDVTNYGLINVEVISNVASATDGLSIQQSPDGTNWDILDPYTIAAATGKTFSVPRQAKFFRVVYTNGGTNQASFRLQTIFTPSVSKPSSVRAADATSNENDLEQVSSFLMGFNGSTWDRLRTTGTGILSVSSVITGTVGVTQSTSPWIVAGGGTAGAAATGVVSVQGIASMTPVQVSQATAANLNATVVGTGTFVVQAAQSGTWTLGASSATGSTVPANAFYKGLLAQTANPSAATAGNLVGALADKLGKQVVVGSIRDLKADAALTLTSTTTETTVIAATASIFHDVFGAIVTNISATACEVIFRDVAAGAPRFSIYVPAGDTRGFMLNESAAFKQATVNTAWTAQCGTSVASIKINLAYVSNI